MRSARREWDTETMPIDVVVGLEDLEKRTRRQNLARRVMNSVDAAIPEHRVLCLLDGVDCEYLKDASGGVNRGGCFQDPEPEVRQHVLGRLQKLGGPESLAAYQTLIYLHGSTCSTDVGLSMTLAHEFQHLKQSIGVPPVYVASILVGKCDELIRARALIWPDVPHEREARIISKRVTEMLFGPEAVRTYLDQRITDSVSKMNAATSERDKNRWRIDAADWLFIQRVDASVNYDFALEIRELYPRLREFRYALERTRDCFAEFRAVDLEPLFSGA